MTDEIPVPRNGRMLLDRLSLTPDLIRRSPEVPVSAAMLRTVLRLVASMVPFDPDFYGRTYPDLTDAFGAGATNDLREHFLEHGYLEGRLGAPPDVDEQFYLAAYPDVAAAVAAGEFDSALDHYVRTGSTECRFANLHDKSAYERWSSVPRT